ncbi:hypothetical protein [Luteolibacter sp. AS25]|uniref:hypothetical protein n=1 Tax=Luteolibacter sp. AS25 TaxID=3135776 RepID=UPI00398B02D5
MKISFKRKYPAGWTTLIGVLTISIFMLTFMIFAYERAMNVHEAQSNSMARTDYREKDEAVLRAIVALTPNAAIGAMGDGSSSESRHARNAFSMRNIYDGALEISNSRQSVDSTLLESIGGADAIVANATDSNLSSIGRMFSSKFTNTGMATAGLNRNFESAFPDSDFPPPLNSDNALASDDLYPLITSEKYYGSLASGKVGLPVADYPQFNLIPYPNINFGYVTPGTDFVAKRNWWAFKMDLSGNDESQTGISAYQREFVLSIYEIPSQLPISASSFMALGQHANGDEWQNVTIAGNIFAGKAQVEGDLELGTLATRRGTELSNSSTISGQNFGSSPFAPGIRENYRLTEGEFFPISQASESGKAAFIPINRGAGFFDRYAHITESATLSPTTWNDYSVGALQCAMTLDIKECVSASDSTPTELEFTYLKNGIRESETVGLESGVATDIWGGFTQVAREHESHTFNEAVDVAYGANGKYYFMSSVTGTILFDNTVFGDPIPGTFKYGYWRPVSPFEMKYLPSGQKCIAIYPERLKELLESLGADDLSINNSIAINVDYTNSTNLIEPSIPCTDNDYGVILQECADLTDFTKGFSLVTNLRLYIGDDFNVVEATPPTGYVPPSGSFYPPCSLFSPEKRYGVEYDPFSVELSGQVGSVAMEDAETPVRPLDATGVTGTEMTANRISINLSQISHPAELPPITMMNWLVVLEEMRKEFE